MIQNDPEFHRGYKRKALCLLGQMKFDSAIQVYKYGVQVTGENG